MATARWIVATATNGVATVTHVWKWSSTANQTYLVATVTIGVATVTHFWNQYKLCFLWNHLVATVTSGVATVTHLQSQYKLCFLWNQNTVVVATVTKWSGNSHSGCSDIQNIHLWWQQSPAEWQQPPVLRQCGKHASTNISWHVLCRLCCWKHTLSMMTTTRCGKCRMLAQKLLRFVFPYEAAFRLLSEQCPDRGLEAGRHTVLDKQEGKTMSWTRTPKLFLRFPYSSARKQEQLARR